VTLALAGPPRGHQHEHDGQIGRVVGQDPRRVGDDDAVGRGGCKVDVVVPDTEVRHDARPTWTHIEGFRIQPVRDRHDETVRAAKRATQR
jgi:hypothetical protein